MRTKETHMKFLNFLRSDFNAQDKLSILSDKTWMEYLLGERRIPERFAAYIPKMPPEKVQLHFTGASGRETLTQAMDFVNLATDILSQQGMKDLREKKLLDFGCGWGRITRMWLRCIPGENITGVDPMTDMNSLCQNTIPNVHFMLTQPAPPILALADQAFDIVTAYSVFSHLNEEYLNLWVNEFARLVKPSGMMFITTRSRKFINHLHQKQEDNSFAEYEDSLKDCFTDYETAFRDYDQGKVIHQPVGGGSLSTSFYGETCIPESYFHRFNDRFELIKFIPNLKYEDNQACAVLERR